MLSAEDIISMIEKRILIIFIQLIQDIQVRDLVQNHLSFFVLNHVAIFEKKLWPKEIVVNGSVMMDGAKMSKSMGNIIPLRSCNQRPWCRPNKTSNNFIS